MSLTARYRSPTAFEFVEEPCHDLSAGGMFIQSPLPAALGTLLKLECEIQGGHEPIRGVARVVWHREEASDEGPRGMGVKFVKLEPGSRELIDQLLSRLGAGSVRPEAEAKAQERRSLAPGPRTSQAPAARTSQAPAPVTSQAPAIEAPAPPSSVAPAIEAPAPPAPAAPEADVTPPPGAPAVSVSSAQPADAGREPTQDRPKKARADAANLRERLDRKRRSHDDISTQEVLAAATAVRAANDTAPEPASREAAATPPVAEPSDEPFTPAEAVAPGSDKVAAMASGRESATTFEAHEVAEPVAPRAQGSNWPKAPGGLAVKIAVGVLLGYLVVLFSPILNTDYPDDVVPTIPEDAPVAATPEPAAPAPIEAPAEPPPVVAAPTDLPAAGMPGEPAVAEPTAPVVAAPEAAPPPPGTTYVVDVITTPEGARVTAGASRIVAPGRLNLGALEQPVKLLAELDGHAPTAALVERTGFDLSEGVMRRHIFLKLVPNAPKAASAVEAPAAPAAASAAEPAAAPAAAAAATAAAAAAPAPAKPAPAKPASTKAASPLETAMACLAQGDNACVIKALDGKTKTAAELELLIETYRGMGRTADAERSMELYLKRYPGERRAATYRRLLDRREAEANAPEAAPPAAPEAPPPAPPPAAPEAPPAAPEAPAPAPPPAAPPAARETPSAPY